ncbi:MAG: ribonuclease P protein component [Desulfobacterota bacterium]|nr:ribonuclease P protein component [Thermodesulfobacteriota bacterium]
MRGLFRFTRKERIALSDDFRRAMRSGRKLSTKHYLLYLYENRREHHRLGIVVKKEVGSASTRNRMKRYLREFFRLNKHQIQGALDIVILVKKGDLPNSYHEVERELKKVLV